MSNYQRTIALVGGSGFVGSSIAKELMSEYDVQIVDQSPPKRPVPGIGFEYCDVRNKNEVERAIGDADVVIHTAIVQIPTINDKKRLGYEVNFVGTQNVCEAVHASKKAKGMILCGTWHTIGDIDLRGTIDETFGFRPDKVEDRARIYALSKIAQESIVRYYGEMSEKSYSIVRLGTVIGDGMSERTAASIFIERALRGQSLTPYSSSMYRPMLFVDIRDVCSLFKLFVSKILREKVEVAKERAADIVNIYYPNPFTVLNLAEAVKNSIEEITGGKISPRIEVVNTGEQSLFGRDDKSHINVDISRLRAFGFAKELYSPAESVHHILQSKIRNPTP